MSGKVPSSMAFKIAADDVEIVGGSGQGWIFACGGIQIVTRESQAPTMLSKGFPEWEIEVRFLGSGGAALSALR